MVWTRLERRKSCERSYTRAGNKGREKPRIMILEQWRSQAKIKVFF